MPSQAAEKLILTAQSQHFPAACSGVPFRRGSILRMAESHALARPDNIQQFPT
jgi:hypothetical protein